MSKNRPNTKFDSGGKISRPDFIKYIGATSKPSGIREPHWHPNASEMGYVLEGTARLIVFSPGGSVDTFEVVPGEIYFISTGFFHFIENLSSTNNMHFAIFLVLINHLT